LLLSAYIEIIVKRIGQSDRIMLEHGELLILTTRIVTSYLGGNRVAADQVSDLIETVAASLVGVHQHGQITEPAPIPTPAVPIRKSVTPDSIICLECGQKMKMLRRHLATDHGMSVDNYRAKWDLPAEYPMVAPSYAQTRSKLAKQLGLGRKGRGRTKELA
jgi:predicted transcriptional regulator